MRTVWTPALDAMLCGMRETGCTYEQIGAAFGVTRGAARNRHKRIIRGAMPRADWLEQERQRHAERREREARLRNDCDKHLARIFDARPEGFPVLHVQPFRRAA